MVCHVVRLVFMWSVMWLGWCLRGLSCGYVGVYVVCHVVRLVFTWSVMWLGCCLCGLSCG